MLWYTILRYNSLTVMAWNGVMYDDMKWHAMLWNDLTWSDLIWYHMIWNVAWMCMYIYIYTAWSYLQFKTLCFNQITMGFYCWIWYNTIWLYHAIQYYMLWHDVCIYIYTHDIGWHDMWPCVICSDMMLSNFITIAGK